MNQCIPITHRVCVVVVVNHEEGASPEVKEANQRSMIQLEGFNLANGMMLVTIDARSLASKNAGVGLARKIGMDACIRAAMEAGSNPVIVCLDADCLVSPSYLSVLELGLIGNDAADVAVLEFKHRTEGFAEEIVFGIQQYELFLEYYCLGLFSSGYPFFHHTVGSSMACKAVVYARSGGMNQRKAGEDFYFLHKLFPHYPAISLAGPLVFPSPRISERVPFGTGRFQKGRVGKGQASLLTYNPLIFLQLKILLLHLQTVVIHRQLPQQTVEATTGLHLLICDFLNSAEVQKALSAILKSSPNPEIRIKSLYRWFDGLMVLRLIHTLRPCFEDVAVADAIGQLAGFEVSNHSGVEAVRKYLRNKSGKGELGVG